MQEMRIYLLNNTKPYREGDEEYSGAWFNCPVDFEEVREKIGVEHEEQIEIADYELPFDLHSDMPLWEINANCRMVLELEGTPIGNEMKAIQQKWFSSFEEFIDHKDEIRYYDVGDGAALAEYLIREEYPYYTRGKCYGMLIGIIQSEWCYRKISEETNLSKIDIL